MMKFNKTWQLNAMNYQALPRYFNRRAMLCAKAIEYVAQKAKIGFLNQNIKVHSISKDQASARQVSGLVWGPPSSALCSSACEPGPGF